MKGISKIFILLLLLVFGFTTVVFSISTKQVEAYSTANDRSSNGISFVNGTDTYDTTKALTTIPTTFEAVIYLPSGYTARAGIILGNWKDTNTESFNFELNTASSKPYPKICYEVKNDPSNSLSFNFKDVTLPTGEFFHLVITHDTTIDENGNTTAYCYINGEQVGSPISQKYNTCYGGDGTTGSKGYTYVPTNKARLGGDLRGGNAQYFKGNIKSVKAYSSYKTSEEIKAAYESTTYAYDETLLASYDLTLPENNYLTDLSGNGYSLNYSGKTGLTFDAGTLYKASQKLAGRPITVEAEVYLPKSYTGRAGVIFGNYNDDAKQNYALEIHNNGTIRLFGSDTANKNNIDLKSSVDIRTGGWAHIAVVFDYANKQAHFYLNGALAQSMNYTKGDMALDIPETLFCVGGDLRSGNGQFFKGAIKSVSAYSDVRSAEEINSDYTNGVSTTDANLLVHYEMNENNYYSNIEDLSANKNNLVCSKSGLTFTDSVLYKVENKFNSVPLSIEAEVYLPKSYSARAGVIFGNYNSDESKNLSLEIKENGKIRFYGNDSSGATIDKTASFDIRTGGWAHIAVVFDYENKAIHYYLDGNLMESIEYSEDIASDINDSIFALGGDLRGGNAQYFKGEIRNVSVYSDVRTSDEIAYASAYGTDLNDENLLACYNVSNSDLNKDIKDSSNNKNNIKAEIIGWYSDEQVKLDYAFSFAVVGDTQVLCQKYPEKMEGIYDWILANQQSKNIQHVFGMGDITEEWTNVNKSEQEWIRAQQYISKLDGKISYSLVRGNHDRTDFFYKYFQNETYMSQFDGFLNGNDINNSYKTMKIGSTDYLFLQLDYGIGADALEWANEVVSSHPNHKVVISTHAYLYRDGSTLDQGDVCPPSDSTDADDSPNKTYYNGEQMWDQFVSKHPNIVLVLSGHDPCEDVVTLQSTGVHGNTVTQMLIDPQGMDKSNGGNAMICMLYFSEDGSKVEVEWLSTETGLYYKESNQYDLDLSNAANATHTYTINYDEYYHYEECECGFTRGKETHTFENPTDTGNGTVISTCRCGATKETSSSTNEVTIKLQEIIEKYYNDGVYLKDTTIFINKEKVGKDLANYFHANIDMLIRTTYYNVDMLWMYAGDDYSGYGTSEDGSLTSFRVTLDGVKGEENVLHNLPGMEEYYCTLKDFILGQHTSLHSNNKTLNLNDGWTYENGIYTNTNADVLDAFRLFTAPGWIGKTTDNLNYVTYTKATIEDLHGELVLKLWVSSENKGLFADGYTNIDSEGNYLFSQAIITEYYWLGNSSTSLEGEGTEENPYLIQNSRDLAYLKDNYDSFAGKHVKLTADLNLNGANFMIESFAGIFDGNNHSINGLNIENTSANTTGFIRNLEQGGAVKNLTIYGSVKGKGIVAGLVGNSQGTVQNCHNYANIYSSDGLMGGVVAISSGDITNCTNYGDLSNGAYGYNIGGVVGESTGNVIGCTNYGRVSGRNTHTGGVVGSQVNGEISNCQNFGEVVTIGQPSGEKGSWGAGGIAGCVNTTLVTNCTNEGNLSSTSAYGEGQFGGISGKTYNSTIKNCSNKGNVTIKGSTAGGIVGDGYETTTVTECSNYGTISATSNVGGIVGNLQAGTVTNSNNYGKIIGTGGAQGGIVGYSKGTVENCVNNEAATISGGSWSAAGVVGHSEGNVLSCKNYAAVTGTKGGVAGVVGELVKGKNIKAENCENYGKVTGGQYTGGIVGYLRNNSVINCVNKGEVTASGTKIGGIAGGSDVTGAYVTGCENHANIKGGQHTAGIIGQIQGSITNCTNYGNITSTSSESSSIFGKLWVPDGTTATVDNCVNYGDVKVSGWAGGLFGNAGNAAITNCVNNGSLEATSGSVGGIIGYVFAGATITDCENYGKITAPTNVCGVAFHVNGTLTNCDNYGELVVTNADGVIQPIYIQIAANGSITNCNDKRA